MEEGGGSVVRRHLKGMIMVMLSLLSFNLPLIDQWFEKESQQDVTTKFKNDSQKAIVYKAAVEDYDLFPAVVGYPAQYEHIELEAHWLTESMIMEQAYKQGMQKFGENIAQKIEPAFKEEIMPELKHVVSQLLINNHFHDPEEIGLTQSPASGRGEKIMHVFDRRTGDDLLRFHVRLDRPPKKGHVFQFHYHIANDNYHGHHYLGSIYWGKNEPPLFTA